MNDEHSRLDFEHYKNCKDCYDDHLDFMEEQRMEAAMDMAIHEAENQNEYED